MSNIDWPAVWADAREHSKTTAQIAADLGIWHSSVRRAATRDGVHLPRGYGGRLSNAAKRERKQGAERAELRRRLTAAAVGIAVPDYSEADATLRELAALQQVPRYDARA